MSKSKVVAPIAALLLAGAFVDVSVEAVVPCAEKSVTASAIRSTEDVEAFVQCAYEYVQEMGFEEARRAFNEDERWKSGPIYVAVTEVTSMRLDARSFVFPPDPSREGQPWGPLLDAFGDSYEELYRIVSIVDEGWIYYAFTNPATGREEPKATYVKRIDWDGTPATIGAGIYRRDLPATCAAEEINASLLESDPSNARLQEFVRCAAMELEANGYFAIRALSSDHRWRNQSIYLFGLDTNGNPLFSGNFYSQSWWGVLSPELNDHIDGPFGGRDVVSVGDAFGETFLYYSTRNPSTGRMQGKVAFVKRIVVSGQTTSIILPVCRRSVRPVLRWDTKSPHPLSSSLRAEDNRLYDSGGISKAAPERTSRLDYLARSSYYRSNYLLRDLQSGAFR